MDSFLKELKGFKFKVNEKLEKYNTYKVKGKVDVVVFPKDENELISVLKLIKKYNLKYKVVGKGSNLVFSHSKYQGVLIRLDNFDNIEITGEKVVLGAGVDMIKASYETAKKGLSGLEFASGIPGTVGGCVFMNAGAYKSNISKVLVRAKVLTPEYEVVDFDIFDFEFGYRDSFLKHNKDYYVLETTFKLEKSRSELILDLIQDRKRRRMESQPLDKPSAGSVFRNPENISAWKVIEDADLKNYSIGNACVSDKHANFIVSKGDVKGEDIEKLVFYIKDKVKKETGIDLKFEQEFVG